MRVRIPAGHLESLAGHARSCSPNESCALLIGLVRGGEARVSGLVTVTNQDGSPDRFSMPAEELISAYAQASSEGLDVVGIFHSHPASPAAPSATDVEYMAINPVPWLIYSGLDGSVRAFVLEGGSPREIPISGKPDLK